MTPGTTSGSTWNAYRVAATAPADAGVVFNGMKFDNKSVGAGTSRAFFVGTGYDEILNHNGTVIINGNGTVNASQLTGSLTTLAVTGTSNLNNVSNVTILGGTNGQVLTTNGAGGLSWTTVSGGGGGASISNGTSNVNIATSGGNVTVGVGGTANVATFTASNLTLGTGSGGNITGANVISGTTIQGFIQPTTGTTTTAPIVLTPGTLLSTPVVGAIEMDGAAIYATENTTSGRGEMGVFHQYRLTTDSSAFGPGITDFFPATSSIQLEASSIYEIDAQVWFLKTTAGTATWTWTNSSAVQMIKSYYVGTAVTGFTTTITTTAPIGGIAAQQTSTALAHAATASMTAATNQHFHFKVHVWTNAATNLRLRLTQSAGTATPRAGSYYAVRKISANAGTFA